ncbi:MAG: hypothetical protein HFG49_04785 [Lachnospiraceae bacterium]|jgi:hypothetical protein|nr:hypothetical protein [Lachnospiraceae bacterium]
MAALSAAANQNSRCKSISPSNSKTPAKWVKIPFQYANFVDFFHKSGDAKLLSQFLSFRKDD